MSVSLMYAQFRDPRWLIFMVVLFLLPGCTGVPDGVKPVEKFQLERYLGRWYEIARLDHSFERGMSSVSATYSMRKDGGVRVLNRGFKNDLNQWSEAEGKAFLLRDLILGTSKFLFLDLSMGHTSYLNLTRKIMSMLLSQE